MGEFSVTDIKHYAYCPVIIYITHFLGVREEATEYMKYGSEIETKDIVTAAVKMVKAKRILRSIQVSSRLGFSGVVDYLLVTRFNEYVPMEIKWSEIEDKARVDHVLQLAAYSIAIEETFNTVVKLALIHYVRGSGGVFVRVHVTQPLRDRVIGALNEMRRISGGDLKGVRVNRRRCISCNYRAYCPINPRA